MKLPDRVSLARLPTPVEPLPRLREAWGGPQIWVKRDDLTGFGLSGNKVRKLEFHLAAALRAGATTVVTCGASQSNHCRATALACARLGLGCLLLLRTDDGRPPSRKLGNLLLAALSGARLRFVTPDRYQEIDEERRRVSAELRRNGEIPWWIPEGASDWLGMCGFLVAGIELADQLERVPGRLAAVWHAASSGGTTAGLGRSLGHLPLVACSIGDPASELRGKVEDIWAQAEEHLSPGRPAPPSIEYLDRYVGGGYGVVEEEDLAVQVQFTRMTGLILDPTYTGKAVNGLRREVEAGRYRSDDHVLFWHTGGGFAAFAHEWGV